jgi:ATP-binding protein involved in chromosome partitioning
MKLDHVLEALRSIKDSSSGRDIVTLGFVKDLKVQDGVVSLKLTRPHLQQSIKETLVTRGATTVNIELAALQKTAQASPHGVPGVGKIIAVSSGKGGVGKSTVAVNLAAALSQLGHRVGLMDCDILGPNVPTMTGLHDAPQARMDETRGELILPLEAHGLKVMSMGLLTRGDQPLVWRGPMLHSVVSQFLSKVDWGSLDYLIVDMPPGTGDVQISLTQLTPLAGAVMVTTPQEVSLEDVRRAILMFEKVSVPILGIVENMSYFQCSSCSAKHEIFGSGGGAVLADKYRVPLLGQLPLEPSVRQAGDSGRPSVLANPKLASSEEILKIAQKVHASAQAQASAGVSPEISGF